MESIVSVVVYFCWQLLTMCIVHCTLTPCHAVIDYVEELLYKRSTKHDKVFFCFEYYETNKLGLISASSEVHIHLLVVISAWPVHYGVFSL